MARKKGCNHALPWHRHGESLARDTGYTQKSHTGPLGGSLEIYTARGSNASMGVHGFEVCDTLFKLLKLFIDLFGAVVMFVLRCKHAGTTARSHENHDETQDEAHAFCSSLFHSLLLCFFDK
jgi:hypothetical protein